MSPVVKELKQHYYLSDSKDGADMALCKIDRKKMLLEYAGAHRPLLVLRDGELIEIKGDKYPIGGIQYRKRDRFNTHCLRLCDKDIILMFSDGLVDQFGGKDNQKMKYGIKRFRDVILRKKNWDIKELNEEIEQEFIRWKGVERQIDDVLIVGLQIEQDIL